MDSEKLQLFLHIAVVIVALGSMFTLPFLQAFAERDGVAATRFMAKFSRRLDNFLFLPGAALTILLGIGLVFSDDELKDDTPAWVGIALVWFLVAIAVDYFLLRKTVRQAIDVLEGAPDSKTLPAAYQPLSKRMQILGGIIGLSIVGIAFLMVWRPGD